MDKSLVRNGNNSFMDLFDNYIDKLYSPSFFNDFEDNSLIVKDDHYEINYDKIPEKLDNLSVKVEDNAIKVEYSYKDDNSSQTFSAYRSLPEDCIYSDISANVENNILKILIPRKESK